MFAATRNPLSAYQRVCVETGVHEADPHKLVLMLYEGALLALADAQLYMTRRETANKGRSLSKAIMIIDGGLKASLDVKAGGELGERLAALYNYMCDRLLHANLHNRPEIIDEVRQLLMELRGAWEQIHPAAAVTAATPSSRYAVPAPSAAPASIMA
jgi:flagellar secretion chaperone FliS